MSASEPLSGLVGPLHALERWLTREGVAHVLIGGVAVSLVARPRFTADIDVTLWLEEARWEAFLGSGAGAGFLPRIPDPIGFARQSRAFLLRHVPTGVGVDLSAGLLPFELEAIERALRIDVAGVPVPVARPEDLIIMKAVAGRPQDHLDIEALLAQDPAVDRGRIRLVTSEFADILETPEIASEVARLLDDNPPGKPTRARRPRTRR